MEKRALAGQMGLSLIELMVSITLGMLVLIGVLLVFASSSTSRTEIEKSGRQIGNGSYAMQLLSQDLQLAGYLGDLAAAPALPGALPDPCATDLTSLYNAVGVHIQGHDNSSGGLGCLSDVKTGTDVLVVRRTSTCSSAHPQDSGCDPLTAGYTYFQVSGCSADAAPPGQTVPPYFLLATNTADLTLKKIGCINTGRMLRYRTHIYFVANNNTSGDGVPTLKRWELGTGIVPLVEGIDNLQFEYGIDNNADGAPEAYKAAPASIGEWANVMAVKVHLLARNTEATAGYTDSKTYALGLQADGSANNVGPFNDGFKRHAYTATIRLANPAGRRE